jgi:thiol-disulfide isomerase/thioredoxin
MLLISIKNTLKHIFIVIMFSLTTISAPFAGDIQLEGSDGKQHALSEYIGKEKWTVLNIWGPKCPPCREEMPDLVRFHDTHKDTDAIVVGIAIDFPSYGYAIKKDVVKFAEDFMIDFPILLSDSSITERLGLGVLQGLPTTYMYTPEGELVGAQVGGVSKEILENFIKKREKR